MRKDEDDIRHYMPALRRIIILVAVLTAVPVAMWTITAFVRTYVGPPKLPTFQRMTASTLTDAPDSTAPAADADNPPAPAVEDATAAPLPTFVEARATTTDARSAVLDIKKPPVGAVGLSTAAAPAVAAPAPAPADPADNIAAPSPTASAMPSLMPNSVAQFAAQQPPAPNWSAVRLLAARGADSWPGPPAAAAPAGLRHGADRRAAAPAPPGNRWTGRARDAGRTARLAAEHFSAALVAAATSPVGA